VQAAIQINQRIFDRWIRACAGMTDLSKCRSGSLYRFTPLSSAQWWFVGKEPKI
jgi:hypothetical protein